MKTGVAGAAASYATLASANSYAKIRGANDRVRVGIVGLQTEARTT